MGLKSDLQRHVLHVQDVTNTEPVAAVVDAVCAAAAPAPVVLVGFSLGGITLPAYLGAHANSTPRNLAGCMCVSGALKTDFISSPHYVGYYQPIIVAGIVRDLLCKYGRGMLALMGAPALEALALSRSYLDLQRSFYGCLPFPPKARGCFPRRCGRERGKEEEEGGMGGREGEIW